MRVLMTMIISFFCAEILSASTASVIYDLAGNALTIDEVVASNQRETSPKDNIIRVINVAKPVVQIFRSPAENKNGTMMIFPGGGYGILAINHEGSEVAIFLNEIGYDAVVVEYTVKNGTDAPLLDAQKAWQLLRDNANEWQLSTSSYGVIGFSAGGHLAARLCATLPTEQQPQTVTLVYPAYLEKPNTQKIPNVLPPEKPTARLLLVLAEKDKREWISSAQQYAQAWEKRGGKMAEYVLLNTGHGFGMKNKLWAEWWAKELANSERE